MTTDLLVPLTAVVGEEDLLLSRAVDAICAAARSAATDMDIRDLDGAAVGPGDLMDLLTPSLFGDRRVVVVDARTGVDTAVADALAAYAADPLDEVSLVLVHGGGVKGRKLLDALLAAGARRVDCAKVTKPSERLDFVREELSAGRRRASEGAVRALVDAVGNDLRELAAACSQLLADTSGTIDEDVVARYHRGRAEATGFAVADRAVEGDLAGALEALRWALSVGIAPVLVSSALASAVRNLAMVASSGRSSSGALAKQIGMPPWKVERLQRQAVGWRPEGVEVAFGALARADGDVKGAAADTGYALERAVLAVVAARGAR